MHRVGHLAAVVLLVGAVSLTAPTPAGAHTQTSQGFSRVSQAGNTVFWDLDLDLYELDRVVATGASPEDSPRTLASKLASSRASLEPYLLSRMGVAVEGAQCEGGLRETAHERSGGFDHARLRLAFDCPRADSGAVTLRHALFVDEMDPAHRNVTSYALAGGRGEVVFDARLREHRVGEGAVLAQAGRFGVLGVEHILSGWDHLLFVIALLLGTSSLAGALKVVTAFTVAHSATLGLTALGLLTPPSGVIEPLIALSVAYVAIEALLGGTSRLGLAAVFGFGLLHGMGFASALQLGGEPTGGALVSLFSFNVGIEVGQALVIAALLPALLLLRRFRWSAVAQRAGASTIFAFGMAWFLQRTLG